MTKHKAILFDLGGVIERIDPVATVRAFGKHGVKNPERIFTLTEQDNIVTQFETGKITDIDFFTQLAHKFEIKASTKEVRDAWITMLLGIEPATIEALRKIRKTKPIYLLSNTNVTHYHHISNRQGYAIESLFDGAIFSFVSGKRKPEQEIFVEAIAMIDAEPENILFIDDLSKNISAAKLCGIDGLLYRTNHPLSEITKTLLLEEKAVDVIKKNG